MGVFPVGTIDEQINDRWNPEFELVPSRCPSESKSKLRLHRMRGYKLRCFPVGTMDG